MKHFTLFAATAMMAASAFAQAPQKFSRKAFASASTTPAQIMMQCQQVARQQATDQVKKAPARTADHEVIYAVDGTSQVYTRTGFSWANLFGPQLAMQDGMAAEVVFDADGKTVYFKDIVTYQAQETYVKGTLSEDGTKITVPMGQLIYFNDDYSYGEKLAMLDWDDNEGFYFADPTVTEAVFTVENGVISLTDTDNEFDETSVTYPTRILGLVYDDIDPSYDGQWSGFGDFHTVMTPTTIDSVVAPEGLQTEKYLFSYDYDSDGVRDGRLVDLGFTDTEVYIKGLSDETPDMWIRGVIDGDQVRVANGQYMGLYAGMFMYMVHAKSELLYDAEYDEYYMGYVIDESDFVFNYDAANKTLTPAVADDALVLNAALDRIYYLYVYLNPATEPYVEYAGIPSDPMIYNFDDEVAEQGLGLMECHIPLYDTNGHFMNPEKLAYKIYIMIDGEIEEYPLYADEYLYLEEDLDEVPYTYNDNYDIATGAAFFYFFQTGFDLMGIQSINYCGDQRHVSNIVWYDGSVTEVEDQLEDPVGIEQLNAAQRAEMVDLMGRKAEGKHGFVIVRQNGNTRTALLK